MTLRGAVVGCGNISPFHLRGWRRIPEVEIVALVDPDRSRAEERRQEFVPEARLFASLDELFASTPVDFVDILTPPALHAAHCLRASRAGVHIICQKPLTDRIEEAEALVAALAGYPKAFVVHENHRFRPWFQDVLRRRDSGDLGEVRFARFEQHDASEPPEPFKFENERGVLLEYGVHMVDLVRALLGEPRGVAATLARLNPRVRGDSFAHVVFDYPRATAVVEISWRAAGVHRGTVVLLGETGEAVWDGRLTRGDEGRYRVVRNETVVTDERRSPTDEYVEAFHGFERAFADAAVHGAPWPQPAADNLRTLRLIFAAYDAATRGDRIALTA